MIIPSKPSAINTIKPEDLSAHCKKSIGKNAAGSTPKRNMNWIKQVI